MRYSVRMVLWMGFGMVVVLFLVASVFTVYSADHILQVEEELARLDHARHHGHLALADIQEQYIHQAHTIILGNQSHLERYNEAYAATAAKLHQLRAACDWLGMTNATTGLVDTLAATDRYFRNTVVEAIETSSQPERHEFHNQLEAFAAEARAQILDLNMILDQKSIAARRNHETYLARTRWVSIATLIAGLLMASAVALALARMIGSPIRHLHETFGRLGAGDMSARVTPDGPRELSELGQGFNTMADELVAAHGKIADKERMAAIGEIAAGVAHELNNPLGVITGYLKLVEKGVSDEQVSKDLSVISDEVDNCKIIVQGLLDLARPARLTKSRLNLTSVVDDVVQRLQTVTSGEMAEIEVQSTDPTRSVQADEAAIKQVLSNILRNALEAAGTDGHVLVRIEGSDRQATVAVSDSGTGIDPEFKEKLFRPFKTTKDKGTGLGLAISLAIAKDHGGDILVDSSKWGGARFTVVLPAETTAEKRTA